VTDHTAGGFRLTLRRIIARLIPGLGYSRCMHCWLPWSVATPRDVPHGPMSATFVVCTHCWPHTTTEQRLHYARHLVFGIWPEPHDWPQIERSYRQEDPR